MLTKVCRLKKSPVLVTFSSSAITEGVELLLQASNIPSTCPEADLEMDLNPEDTIIETARRFREAEEACKQSRKDVSLFLFCT